MLPVKTRKLKRSAQSIWLLCARTPGGDVFLQRRPTPAVRAGLYCFALSDSLAALTQCVSARQRSRLEPGPVFTHVLTHKDLHLHPVWVTASGRALKGLEGEWFGAMQWPNLGLPAPVRKLLAGDAPPGLSR